MADPTPPDPRWLAAMALVPLLAFWLLDSAIGTGPALAAAMVFGVADLGWRARATGKLDRMGLAGLLLLVALAVPSWLSGDERFARLAPAVGDALVAVLLLGAELLGRSPLVAALREVEPDPHPLQIRALRGLAVRLSLALLVHGGLVVATASDEAAWKLVSGPVQWVMLGGLVAAEAAWMRWVVLPAIEAEEEKRT